jgi:hypothetical protein
MSRVYYGDDWDDNAVLNAGRWERNSQMVLKSKKGQRVLREIEKALVSLPEKRLSYETFCKWTPTGEIDCCVLGAYAMHMGKKPSELEYLNGDEDGPYESANETASQIAGMGGMTFTMAWNLIELNDETFGRCTPEERYEKTLQWVRRHLEGSSR